MDRLLSVGHLLTLAVTAALIASLVIAARLRRGPWTVVACRILAVVILANEAAWWVWLGAHGTWSASFALPLQLCDVAAVVAFLASDEAGYVTGEVINVGGGYVL